jgi:hypothetical protein
MQKAPVAVHHRSACSGVKALRNTSDARRQAAKLCYRFGPFTPSARSANLIPGDGTKNGLSRSEQKTVSTTQNNRLTGKAPYKSAANLDRRRQRRPRAMPLGNGALGGILLICRPWASEMEPAGPWDVRQREAGDDREQSRSALVPAGLKRSRVTENSNPFVTVSLTSIGTEVRSNATTPDARPV